MPKCLLHPSGHPKRVWNIVMAILLVYTATVMPYRMAFIDSVMFDTWFWIELMMDFLFFIDVIVNIFSAYYKTSGKLITNRKQIF
jgi:hypothetical protein